MTNANLLLKNSAPPGVLAALGFTLLMLFALLNSDTVSAQTEHTVNFDHLKTGFPLTGAHVQLPCESCHIQGIFKGTPKKCETCHTPGSRIQTTTFKPSNHIPTILGCVQCHSSTASWSVARFSHAGVAIGQCAQCHNGSITTGKPTNHLVTTASCDSCHRTTTWMSAGFNHIGVAPGTCATCHGVSATGKPSNHIPTTLSCDACHAMNGTFANSTFTHSAVQGVLPGQCANCHNGSFTSMNALGKPSGHVATTASCDSCHTGFASFTAATFDHTGVSPGQCSTCHTQGGSGMAKPSNHIPTTLSCDLCHTTGGSFSTSTFSHTAAQGVVPGQCSTCHNGSYDQWNALGKPSNHVTTTASCDSCHTGYSSFAGAGFNHTGIAPGTCATCHTRGGSGMAKPSNHIPTTLSCDACHNTSTFSTSTFTHSAAQGVVPGQCSTCHNGAYTAWNALGKPSNHVATTDSCDSCHTGFTSFSGAGFNHTGIAPGTCATCHTQGGTGMAMPTNHIPTTVSCDACHNTSTFSTSTFSHSAAQGVVPGQCSTCHNGAYTAWNALGKPSGHIATTASCDSCHSGYTTFANGVFSHTGIAPGTCATCHYPGGAGLAEPNNHIPYKTQLLAGTSMSCDACHSSTTSFSIETMNHNNSPGNGAGWCKGCHASGTSYLGNMQRKSLTHRQSSGVTDCSQSGCHRPLGNRGSTYRNWD